MIFKIVTLFPEFFESPFQSGLLGKAIESGIIEVQVVDLREYSDNKHRRCDDYTYGGGSGMVLSPAPFFNALEDVKTETTKVVFATPSGSVLTQKFVKELSEEKELCFICGNYEGVDQRVIDHFVDYEISIGDYILSGGEFASLVIIDAVARYVPGFMSNEESLVEESFEEDLLEYPHYTRPAEFRGMNVPEILLSGHHKKIEEWRLQKKIEKTRKVRPDLYKKYLLRELINKIK